MTHMVLVGSGFLGEVASVTSLKDLLVMCRASISCAVPTCHKYRKGYSQSCQQKAMVKVCT